MKKANKKSIAILLTILSLGTYLNAQVSVPTNGVPGTAASYVGWNATRPFPLTISHKGNFPILFETAGINRMLIDNGTVGFNQGRIAMGNNLLVGFAAQDRLHLHQNARGPLMRFTNDLTGVAPTDGFRIGIVDNATATLLNLENTAMEFYNNNIQRMHINADNGTTDGFIGMGNGFNNPQSLLHLNSPLNEETWLQITNEDVGETPTDGFRLGILDETPGQPSFGYLRWQEKTPFIIQTQNVIDDSNSERIRITTNQGNPDPYNPEGDNTRVGISNRGAEHITLIRSLLHLGYNTGFLINNINATDGWRNWMDVGTFTNNGRENMYVGLKQEAPGIIGLVPQPGARFDAIINWGDNEPVPADGRFNNLRFIYTTPETTTNNQPHTAWNGLETMRIEPTVATTLAAPNFGMVGIGDFSPEGPNTAGADVVNAKLDIDGDLRIRTVTEASDLAQVLVIDPADQNRVHWRNVDDLGSDDQNLTLLNGILSIEDGNSVDLSSLDTDTDQQTLAISGNILSISSGNSVTLPVGTGGTVTAQNGLNTNISGTGAVELGGSLLHNTQIWIGNGKNFQLEHGGNSNISIGSNNNVYNSIDPRQNIAIGAGNTLNIANNSFTLGNQNIIEGQGIYNGNSNFAFGVSNRLSKGIFNFAFGHSNIIDNDNIAPFGPQNSYAIGNNNVVRGVRCMAIGNKVFNPGGTNYPAGGYLVSIGNNLDGSNSEQNDLINLIDGGTDPSIVHLEPSIQTNHSIPAININGNNYIGVKKYSPSCALDVYGSICATGSITPSDSTMKTNIIPLTNTLDLINQLRPISYEWINKRDTFMYGTQYGFTAQQVETVIPNLVHLGLDGKKVLNYTGLFAFLTQGIKEQQKTIDSMETTIQQQDSINTNLETRLTYLENCITKANICEEGNRTINTEPSNNTNYKSVELTNVNSIILDQNLPNPFKENTVINYNIPQEVSEAKLLFYDLNGRIIKELIIDERGESKLTVYGTNLKTGVYTYSLIADGELIATKKMVKK